MARKPKKEEHVNHERWLVSYADFITLLFAFFTSMYAISTVDAKKAGQMVFSTRAAFNLDFFPTDKPVLGSSSTTPPSPIENIKIAREQIVAQASKTKKRGSQPSRQTYKGVEAIARELRARVQSKKLGESVTVRVEKQGLVVSLAEAAFFDAGHSEVKKSSLPAFDAIVEVLASSDQIIRVEGHTDDSPVAGKIRSNWQLSAERAVNVVTYLSEEFAYPPEHLSVAGFAATKPIGDNSTAAGRARNRRVDLVLLGQAAPTRIDATPELSP